MSLPLPFGGAAEVFRDYTIDANPQSGKHFPVKSEVRALLANYEDRLQVAGLYSGLRLSNNVSDPTNDIDVAAGAASDSTGAVQMRLASAITKRLDASWAVGTGQGGLDTGSIANASYHVHLIMRLDTGVVDVLFSLSPTAPTLPASYSYFRRIGSIIRRAGAIVAFSQFGNEYLITDSFDYGAVPGVTTAVLAPLAVPTGIQVLAIININLGWVATGNYLLVTSPDQADVAADATHRTIFVNSTTVKNSFGGGQYRTDTSGRIRIRVDDATLAVQVSTRGWYDLI